MFLIKMLWVSLGIGLRWLEFIRFTGAGNGLPSDKERSGNPKTGGAEWEFTSKETTSTGKKKSRTIGRAQKAGQAVTHIGRPKYVWSSYWRKGCEQARGGEWNGGTLGIDGPLTISTRPRKLTEGVLLLCNGAQGCLKSDWTLTT